MVFRGSFIATALCILLLPFIASAASDGLISLNGEWDFRYDPAEYGEDEGWHEPVETSWNSLQVPMSFNASDNAWYSGHGWYRRSFTVPVDWDGERIFLQFEGVNIRSKVWVNGELAGTHDFPYLPFELDITEKVKPGDTNWLVVMADNNILERAIPDTQWDGWWNYGGIIRDVNLVRRPNLYTRDAIVETRMSGEDEWLLDILLNAHNFGQVRQGMFRVVLKDMSGNEIWSAVSNRQVSTGLTQYQFAATLSDVESWSPESPTLYNLRIFTSTPAVADQHEKHIRVGFREIETDGTRILLNGEPLLIHGISRHEMYPGVGMSLSYDRLQNDLQDIKELGCNMIRTSHYAQDPGFYDLADEMGFLVWTEIPAWKTDTEVLTDPLVWQKYGKPQLQSLVHNFRSHPSVVLWSVGNEFNSNTDLGAEYVQRATRYVRSIDPTRLVSFASDSHRPDQFDQSFEFVDVIAVNEYYGWYYYTMNDVGAMLDRLHSDWPDKPILVAEFGSGSVLDMRNENPEDSGKDYSIDYQNKFISRHLEQIYAPERRDYVVGSLVWLYNDFPDPHRVGSGHPVQNNYINSKGLVTRDRTRKPAFDLVKEYFNQLRESGR